MYLQSSQNVKHLERQIRIPCHRMALSLKKYHSTFKNIYVNIYYVHSLAHIHRFMDGAFILEHFFFHLDLISNYCLTLLIGISGFIWGGMWPVASCNELNRLAPLTSLQTAINNRRRPTAIRTAVITVLAIGGAVVARFIRLVTSVGRPLMP